MTLSVFHDLQESDGQQVLDDVVFHTLSVVS
jgi:hypothetical protein